MKLNQKIKTTMSLAAAMGSLVLTATSAQAAVTLVGTPDFTLSSSTTSGVTHDNLPAAFDSQIASGDITATSTFSPGSSPSRVTDGDLSTGGSGSWSNSAVDASGTMTLSFASTDLAGIIFNWGWGDRTPGDYEIEINGTTSLGTFRVDTGGGTSAQESTEPNTYVIFDTVQMGVTSVDINMSSGGGNANAWGFDEIEVYTGVVPEPSTTALLGLGGLALILRRRK